VERSVLKKAIIFSSIFLSGIYILYVINFVWVITVLILIGIALGVSGIPSKRIAPYPADEGVLLGHKIRRLFKK